MVHQEAGLQEGRERTNSNDGKKARGSARASKPRRDLYQEITDKIVAELEAGTVPWVQPWGKVDGAPACGLPQNAATGRAYSGINILLLWGEAFERGFGSGSWLTFKQVQELNGSVRKGERGTGIVYADRFTPKDQGAGEAGKAQGDDTREVWFLKRYTVFNADQCEGLPDKLSARSAELPEREQIPHAEALIAATGADFRIGSERAYYAPSQDFIQVPPQPAFREQINYYRTCFHELGHWTGHASRLDRKLTTSFGTKDYAREELVAEMASAFLCASLGIVPTVRHTDYLGSWLKVLKEDKRAIFKAASAASKAADYVRACQAQEVAA